MNIKLVVSAYIECALWSSTNEDGEPLDSLCGIRDCSPEMLQAAESDCADFLALCETEGLDIDHDSESAQQFGHDFWLTRNGHGAGFLDRGMGKLGNDLTKWAKTFGSVDLYVGDDGMVHAS